MKKTIIAICILVALGVFSAFWAFQEPVPTDRLSQLQTGMSQAEVKAILGEPAKVYPSGQWTYTRPLVFGFVNIHWQMDGTYDGEYNYERF